MTGALLRVVTYHRVLDAHTWPGAAMPAINPSLVSATPAAFAEQMRRLARRWRVVSASEVVAAYREERPLPARAVLLTFDDAYRDLGEIAWPILRRLGLPATVFVPTAYPDSAHTFWWDRLYHAVSSTSCRTLAGAPLAGTPLGALALDGPAARRASLRALQRCVKALPHDVAMRLVDRVCAALGGADAPPSDVLGWDALRALARDGLTVGAHTRTHPALDRVPAETARAEIAGSRDDLRRALGTEPGVFAYPYGRHDAAVVDAVRAAGFAVAMTCLDGHNAIPAHDPLRLRRTNVTPRTSPALLGLRLTAAGGRADRLRHRTSDRLAPAYVPPSVPPDVPPDVPVPAVGPTVAYVMSRFPKLTETFVLNEMVAVEALGARVVLYPLLRERQAVAHPEAERWAQRAHFHPFLSGPILRAQWHYLRRAPRAYAKLFAEVLRRTWGSANFVVGALGIFPKAVRFAYEMERTGVEHVHAHFATHPAVAALIVHRLTGIPYSFTAHGSDLHVDRRMLDAKVAEAAFAVAVSAYNRRLMIDTCGPASAAKIHVVHCGVDLDAFAPRPAVREPGPLRLLCVASYEEVKGHRHLLDACALLDARGVDYVCDLVGEGPLRRDVERRIAALGLGGRVRMLGARPRPEVIALLQRADVAVLPSRPTAQGKREGIPVVLMEAMASALPVVSSAISGIPELVDDGATGLLVPPGEPAPLADALARLAGDAALRRRFGEAGRAKVLGEFDLRTNAAALLALVRTHHAPPPRAAPAPRACPARGGDVELMRRPAAGAATARISGGVA